MTGTFSVGTFSVGERQGEIQEHAEAIADPDPSAGLRPDPDPTQDGLWKLPRLWKSLCDSHNRLENAPLPPTRVSHSYAQPRRRVI